MKTLSKIFSLLLLILLSGNLLAQEEQTESRPIELSLQLKNAHIWRSIEVTSSSLIDADVRLTDKSKTFAVGIWGATAFDGDFREFDYYVSFKKAGFSMEVWDILNFSPKNKFDAIENPGGYDTDRAFNYKAKETGRFVDVRLAYQLPKSFPLRLGWNTVVFGRDRGFTNQGNRYSTYVEAEYPILKDSYIDLKVGIAGAFALRKEKIDGKKVKNHFYGETEGITNVNLVASKTVDFGNYKLPIAVMGVWAPEADRVFMEVSLNVLQF